MIIVVPGDFSNYFLGSAGASASLLGLLFVAISLAPERIIGRESSPLPRAQAASAFTALLGAFFVSMVALIPTSNLGYPGAIMSVIGITNTLSLGRHFSRVWHVRGERWGIVLLFGSLFIYAYQLWYSADLLLHSHDVSSVKGLAYLLLGSYAIGLGRAWELLGAQHEGLLTLFGITGEQNEATADAVETVSEPQDELAIKS